MKPALISKSISSRGKEVFTLLYKALLLVTVFKKDAFKLEWEQGKAPKMIRRVESLF